MDINRLDYNLLKLIDKNGHEDYENLVDTFTKDKVANQARLTNLLRKEYIIYEKKETESYIYAATIAKKSEHLIILSKRGKRIIQDYEEEDRYQKEQSRKTGFSYALLAAITSAIILKVLDSILSHI